jgi:DNA helicase-2/ATP-dependent DNA helicase PcrA
LGAATGLDPDQQRVVTCRDRTIRVVAPAGAGKTRTVVERVLIRIRAGLDPQRILVLTFDNSAAAALESRFAERSREEGTALPEFRVATLNAFGYALLRRHSPSEFRPVATGDELEAIAAETRAALARKSPQHEAVLPPADDRAWAELFGRLKNALFDSRALDLRRLAGVLAHEERELFEHAGRRDRARVVEAVAWLMVAYDRALALRGRIDFDDQKLRACLALRESPELRRRFQSRWSEVVVDEFQDINRLDFELIGILSARATLVVVGDDDQAIYAFRGCSPEWIIDLEKRSGRRLTSLELRTNYRNPPNLLAAAVRLIRRNRCRIPKRPVASRTDEATIDVAVYGSAIEQAEGVARSILRARRRDHALRFRDVAILYRVNAQSQSLRAALRSTGIPCVVREEDDGSESPGHHTAAADAVSLLTYFRAKGLQWPIVFLTSCNEGLTPHRRSPVEDERRLFYVAMTRASAALHVSFLDPTDGAHPPASRFLRESGILTGRETRRGMTATLDAEIATP